ncbi:DNA-directed RNA polymerase I subunit rpa49 [Neolecta irregularis DAH-3]|uniref:DNA-directed RNA polymerase I subunit rpa49 n=1 Tax=Neolecta irregularis (strain DAH-3) TaxID=1198029 RepID=A0A1U7LWV4_NEOID|nr:DNA-directed RNA polymerase I subunit rpa49 [Neolecta irregularis DAH-3]|eukprot:OLL26991.1 DNA-directed RNA polymerase I subunit rpa49 [Neolecta irregularis DAH-3]
MPPDKKRRYSASDISIDSISVSHPETATPPAFLASFPGIEPPTSAKFTASIRQGKDANDYHLRGRTSRMEYNGLNNIDEEVGAYDFYIGIFDGNTKDLKLVPTPMFVMNRTIKDLQSAHKKPSKTSYVDQRNALGETFGTKKSRLAIKSELSNQVDSTSLSKLADTIIDNVKTATENLPSAEILKQVTDADRPIPPPNMSATNVQEAYNLSDIITEDELSAINVKSLIKAKEPGQRAELLPFSTSQYINEKLNRTLSGDAKDVKRIKILYYISLLMAFHTHERMVWKKDKLAMNLKQPPQILIDGLMRRFTDISGIGQPGFSARIKINAKASDKVLCYLFCLCLMLDNYSADIYTLSTDLSLRPQECTELFKTLGCKITLLTETQRSAIGISKAEAAQRKRAVLKVPLEFPVVKKGPKK